MKRLRLALIWSKKHIRRKRTLNKLQKLCRRAAQFKIAYQFPMAHRTSNMLARLMNHQDRLLYTMQYFHGDKESARLYLRSMAIIWNFIPMELELAPNALHGSRHKPILMDLVIMITGFIIC